MKRLSPGIRALISAAAIAVAGVVSLAGCGSSGSTTASGGAGSTAAATGATASTPSGAASTPAAAPSTPVASTDPASGTPACPTRYLKAALGVSQGAAGSVYIVLDFTNISNAPCTLYGYPGVSLAGGTPVTEIGPGADRSTTTAKKLITLAPGAVANALLRIAQAANYPSTTCAPKPSTYLQIFPPNQTTPIYLAYKTTACSKPVRQLTIGAVAAGSGG